MANLEGFNFIDGLHYSKDHVWVKDEGNGEVRLGFDDIVVRGSTEIFFIKLSPVGTKISKKGKMGIIESRKYTGPILSPVTGEIIEVNNAVIKRGVHAFDDGDSYGNCWLVRIKTINLDSDIKELMNLNQALETFREEAETASHEIGHEKSF